VSIRRPIVLQGEPPTFVEIEDPDEARLAEEIFATQWRYLHGRADAFDLSALDGRRINGRLVEIDPQVLADWARRGEFDLAEVYREMFG